MTDLRAAATKAVELLEYFLEQDSLVGRFMDDNLEVLDALRAALVAFDREALMRALEAEALSWAVYACERHVRCHTATEPFEADMAEHEEVDALFELRKSVAKLLAARAAAGKEKI